MNLTPLFLSLKLALTSSLLLLLTCLPLAWFFSRKEGVVTSVMESLISVPSLLPPTVLGFYLLSFFSLEHVPGRAAESLLGQQILFSFPGIVLASVIYSVPFMYLPLKNGFALLDEGFIEASLSLGKSRLATFLKIDLPLLRSSILTGFITAFAHTMGAFGVIIMVGGNIPGKTKVASITIYESLESLNYHEANVYALIFVGFSLVVLLSLQYLQRKEAWRR